MALWRAGVRGLLFAFLLIARLGFAVPPEILLANVYHEGIDPAAYLVSEKLDGVRAIWDGKNLHFRSGHPVNAPHWFTAALPTEALDGELWIARGQFEKLSATVRRSEPVDEEWRQVRYMIFELPGAAGRFSERVAQIRKIVAQVNQPWLQAVVQHAAVDRAKLEKMLTETLKQGGEGLMLHRADALYESGRSDTLLKLKPWLDAEGEVIAHLPGKGKYAGLLGALQLRLSDGQVLRLGTGFSDAQRRNPPPVGARVTYRYRELTRKGLPRFASFVRVRED
ncbi:MAG: DNA ligase [Azonexus sp.]|nr:DNA ligase [Azonexus sp.]